MNRKDFPDSKNHRYRVAWLLFVEKMAEYHYSLGNQQKAWAWFKDGWDAAKSEAK